MKPTIVDLAESRPRSQRKPGHTTPLTEARDDTLTVVALDPGGVTGWSIMDIRRDAITRQKPLHRNITTWIHGQVDCRGAADDRASIAEAEARGVLDICRMITQWTGCAVVIEDFVLRTMSSDRDLLSPVRITAAVEQFLWGNRITPVIQSAAEAKAAATDERLKTWGLYDPTHAHAMRHARDADRHALTFLRKASMHTASGHRLRAAAWPHLYSDKTKRTRR